jgi:Domain of unknown function (DUF4157)
VLNVSLGPEIRALFQARLGHDFSRVQAHADIRDTAAAQTEAERITGEVPGMPQPGAVIRGPGHPSGHARQHHLGVTALPPVVREVVTSPGRPLDGATRSDMEPRFGWDFSHVRVHTDGHAAQSARAVGARAYTVGSHVVFGVGQPSPQNLDGRQMLAHELAHVVQAEAAIVRPSRPASTVSAMEREARHVAAAVSNSGSIPVIQEVAGNPAVPLREEPEDPGKPTYGNLPLDVPDPSGVRRRVRLVNENGVWYEQHAGGAKNRASGQYSFVVQNGEIWATKPTRRIGVQRGHTEAAAGGRVEYAGTAWFGTNKQERGKLFKWSNASGHFAPVSGEKFSQVAISAGLPKESFKPLDPKQVGRPPAGGPQMPVFQPKPGEVLVPSSKVGAPTGPGAQDPSVGAEPGMRGTAAPAKTPSGPASSTPTTKTPSGTRTAATGSTSVTAAKPTQDPAATQRSTWQWGRMAKFAAAALSAWNVYGLLEQAAKARWAAYATLASRTGNPFQSLIDETDAQARRAKEIQDQYSSLDLRESFPREGEAGWENSNRVRSSQEDFLIIELDLHDALDEIESAIRNLKLQRIRLHAGIEDQKDSLTLALLQPTSLVGLEAYLLLRLTEAGQRADQNLSAAMESYLIAKRSVFFNQKMAQAAVKHMEMRLRQMGEDPGGVFWFVKTEDLFKRPLSEFNIRKFDTFTYTFRSSGESVRYSHGKIDVGI